MRIKSIVNALQAMEPAEKCQKLLCDGVAAKIKMEEKVRREKRWEEVRAHFCPGFWHWEKKEMLVDKAHALLTKEDLQIVKDKKREFEEKYTYLNKAASIADCFTHEDRFNLRGQIEEIRILTCEIHLCNNAISILEEVFFLKCTKKHWHFI